MGGPHGLPQSDDFRHSHAGEGHASASLRRSQSAGAAARTAAGERQDSLARRRPACSRADRAAFRSWKPRSRKPRSREPRSGSPLQGVRRQPKPTETGFETRQQAPQGQSAQAAAAPISASPRGMRTLIGVLILVALLPSALFAAMISFGAIHLNWPAPWPKAASSDLAFGACFGRRCPSAAETTSSARAEACRRDGQCSARAPRAAKCSRGGS